MKSTNILILVIISAIFAGCNDRLYKKTADGIKVTVINGSNISSVSLKVINDDIIRVSSVPGKELKEEPGMMCTYDKTNKNDWTSRINGDTAILETSSLKACVSTKTGEVAFYNLNGKLILKEQNGGGKTFSKIKVDNQEGYTMRQVFESEPDEALYGLGQHQSDEFNYKGKNETLYQYNTKVSVPFLVSSKNYGILWDNYSLTRFGDPRPYENLDQFRLFDKSGKEGGLTATYMINKDPKNIFVERNENKVDYENLETVKNFPENFPFNNSAINWEGEIQPKETGLYHFILYYAGYTKVYLDEKLVVAERWRTAWNPNSYKFTANLEKDKKHKIRIEWIPDGGVSYISLKALSPVPQKEQEKISFWSEMGKQIDYYFIKGDNADKVISGYRTITGKAQVMPKWSMGFWQSRERYRTQDELLSTLREFRKRQIPIDNIVQDWSYWVEDQWGSHDFDKKRFPAPEAMIREIHDSSARIMISVWPKFYHNTEHFKELDAKGWMYRQAVNDSIKDWISSGYIGSFYDAYSEGARKLYWKQMDEHLYSKGIDAWWMDASEPDILSNASIDYRKKLMNPTACGSSTEFFNGYGLMNAKGIYEGQRSTNNDARVFLLTRSGYAGSQRYGAAIWSGDIGTRWEDMKAQISAGLNYSVSGNPYWTMDDGGFCVEKRYERAREGSADLDEWRELNVRWHQFGAFAPLFRSHGQYPYREIWNIAPNTHPAYGSMKYYNDLRYRLMPYVYTLAGMCHFNDYTIMRPLVMDFANDKNVYNIGDQYMFGPSIMVCPVYQYKTREKSVYFPSGGVWYNLYDGTAYEGGINKNVSAPYEKMPVFVCAGSIIPTGKLIQSTAETQKDLTVLVYAGKNGEFSLYEDENLNYNYEKGKFSKIRFSYNDKTGVIEIADRKGSFEGMTQERKISFVYITQQNTCGLDNYKINTTVNYTGKKLSVNLK
jgi:alpha-D-xyloside xylohydrolase